MLKKILITDKNDKKNKDTTTSQAFKTIQTKEPEWFPMSGSHLSLPEQKTINFFDDVDPYLETFNNDLFVFNLFLPNSLVTPNSPVPQESLNMFSTSNLETHPALTISPDTENNMPTIPSSNPPFNFTYFHNKNATNDNYGFLTKLPGTDLGITDCSNIQALEFGSQPYMLTENKTTKAIPAIDLTMPDLIPILATYEEKKQDQAMFTEEQTNILTEKTLTDKFFEIKSSNLTASYSKYKKEKLKKRFTIFHSSHLPTKKSKTSNTLFNSSSTHFSTKNPKKPNISLEGEPNPYLPPTLFKK